jgi:REP element-mobilizing transposase RayT
MIRGFHCIFTAYGFWLPNDPRGSWSDFVRQWELARFGKATHINTRRSVASARHHVTLRQEAKRAMKFAPMRFDGLQARSIANGIHEAATEGGYLIHALAILPEHVHAVIAWHERDVRRIVGHLKARATQRLSADGLNPMTETGESPWARKSWDVYLNEPSDVRRAIAYVEQNPVKEGYRRQAWNIVRPYAE